MPRCTNEYGGVSYRARTDQPAQKLEFHQAAVIHLSKSLAMEWIDRGVRVNSISPGYTATPMNLRPEMAWQTKKFEADTPMGRMAKVDELVGPAIFLSSQAASFCTGVDLVVDGGFVCW